MRKDLTILTDESGQTLVLFAVFMSMAALGFLAFAVDVGSLFQQKRAAQAAADAAAVAAAEEASEGAISNEQTVANAVAKLNGFDTTLANNPATVALSTPISGSFSGPGFVQATVSMPVHTIFMGAFSSRLNNLPVSATSIAGPTMTQTCVCLEGSVGTDILMSNGSKLVANACGIINNSSSSNAITLTGGASISGLSLGTISTAWNNAVNINNGASYDGILAYQASGDATTMTIQGGTDHMRGARCLPSAQLYLANGSGSTMSGGIVAASLNMLGGATLIANADVSIGTTAGAAKLVQ